MLKVTITSASVRTGRLPISQRTPSPMSWRMWVSTFSRTAPLGVPIRLTSTAASATQTGLDDEWHRHADREQERPERRADELVDGHEAGHDPGVGDAEVGLVDQHRGERACGGVGEDLGRAERKHRDHHQRDVHPPGDDDDAQPGEDDRAERVHHDHDQASVEPVGQSPGHQSEQQPRQPARPPLRPPPAGGCGSATRPAAVPPPPSARRRGCWPTTTRAATGNPCRGGPVRRLPRDGSQCAHASRRWVRRSTVLRGGQLSY